MRTLEELRALFEADRFAMEAGIGIDSAADGEAVCSLALGPGHLNAEGYPQGGLMYTLADFAFAVAANHSRPVTVTLDGTIHYMKATRAKRLSAKAVPRSAGRTTCVYEVLITDEAGNEVALATFTGYTKRPKNK